MLRNCSVYASVVDLPRRVIADAAAKSGGSIDESAGGENDWTSIDLVWNGARVAIRRMTDRAQRRDHLSGFAGYVMKCNGGKMTAPTYALIDRVLRTKHVLGMEAEPGFSGPAIEFVRALSRTTRSIGFIADRVVDDHERALASPDGVVDPAAAVPRFPSSLERKARSEARLAALGVKVPEHLPPIQGDEETAIRDARSIVRRLSCVFATGARGAGMDRATAKQIAHPESITEAERVVLEADAIDPKDAAQVAWLIEAAGVLLWALGRIPSLEDATEVLDPAMTGEVMMASDPRDLVAGGVARTKAEILDEADFFFRAHWATTDARVNKRPPPPGLFPSVVLERRRAVQWLTSHRDADWDEVVLDT